MHPIFPTCAALLCIAASLATTPVHAAGQNAIAAAAPSESARGQRPPEDKEQLERRLASVSLLLEASSAAKQIELSGNAQAQALRASARLLHQQAVQAQQKGDLAGATSLLDDAAKMMFSAARLAAPEQLLLAKQQRDFEVRLQSVTALLAAQQRIGVEKNLGARGLEAIKALEAQLRQAVALAAAGKLGEALPLLQQVDLSVKVSIGSMRKGESLVRSLKFASKEEEYHYEIDRNDTHQMLAKMLLDEKRVSHPALDATVQKFLAPAARLRAEADALAARKDYAGAIKLLEDATRELVRAIRGAGLYIPG